MKPIIEHCPKCRAELEHIDIKGEDVYGCPKCKVEVSRAEYLKSKK